MAFTSAWHYWGIWVNLLACCAGAQGVSEATCGFVCSADSAYSGAFDVRTGPEPSSTRWLEANITESQMSVTQVNFEPTVQQLGNYSISMYTPGCIQEDTCELRGNVNITICPVAPPGSPCPDAYSFEYSQTNDFDKVDEVYRGIINTTTPSVIIQPTGPQGAIRSLVAQRLDFNLINATAASSPPDTPSNAPSSSPSPVPTRSAGIVEPGASGLSNGAKIGIGVGCGLAGLLILVLAAWLWRRRRLSHHPEGSLKDRGMVETSIVTEMDGAGLPRKELVDFRAERVELEQPQKPVELDGTSPADARGHRTT